MHTHTLYPSLVNLLFCLLNFDLLSLYVKTYVHTQLCGEGTLSTLCSKTYQKHTLLEFRYKRYINNNTIVRAVRKVNDSSHH